MGREARAAPRLGRAEEELHRDFLPHKLEPIEDPEARRQRIDSFVRGRAIGLAALGLIPTSFVAEAIAGYLQFRMVRVIGYYYGYRGDSKITRALLASLAGVIVVHSGVTALVRLVPGWSSAIGAASNFATTFALGYAADRYFASGGKLDQAALKNAFREARRRGSSMYAEQKEDVATEAARVRVDVDDLERRLDAGELTGEEVARKLREDLERE